MRINSDLNRFFSHCCTLPATRWLHARLLPLFLLLTLSLPLPASPSHPSDEKEHSSPFPRNISAASLGSLITHHNSANHTHQPEPSVTDPLMGTVYTPGDMETCIDMEKNDVQVSVTCFQKVPFTSILHYSDFAFLCFLSQQKEPTLVSGMHRSKSKHELKLLEKIPENAEATVVLVGKWSSTTTLKPHTLNLKYQLKITCTQCTTVCMLTVLSCPSSRQCGLPGAAHHGVCAAAGGCGAGVRPRGPCSSQVSLRSAGTPHHQHGLSPDRTLHLHTYVWQGEWAVDIGG